MRILEFFPRCQYVIRLEPTTREYLSMLMEPVKDPECDDEEDEGQPPAEPEKVEKDTSTTLRVLRRSFRGLTDVTSLLDCTRDVATQGAYFEMRNLARRLTTKVFCGNKIPSKVNGTVVIDDRDEDIAPYEVTAEMHKKWFPPPPPPPVAPEVAKALLKMEIKAKELEDALRVTIRNLQDGKERKAQAKIDLEAARAEARKQIVLISGLTKKIQAASAEETKRKEAVRAFEKKQLEKIKQLKAKDKATKAEVSA